MKFEHLTYERQIDRLDQWLDEDRPPAELLETCAGLRDYAPLAWLAARLLELGWFESAGHRRAFADFLLARPDTTVQGVVDELVDRTADARRADHLRDILLASLRRAPLERLTATSIVDRALKQQFPEARRAYFAEVRDRVGEAIRTGDLRDLEARIWMAVSGEDLPELRRLAEEFGRLDQFDAVRRDAAREAVDALGDVPKGVSQSNAEDLLSSRVYTDPGHFLLELLQNAEDAGARRWRVDIEPDRIVVTHDGFPFDFRDVVGITSIGQTTKSKSEIGFFGVGFKSVYEVTDRPRLYSDVFQFEIVDVSIPQWLGAQRPEDVPDWGTVLVLPLDDAEGERTPSALYENACELDPWVLFPLPNIDTIDLRLDESCQHGPRRRAFRECEIEGTARAGIELEPSGERRHFALDRRTFEYPSEQRAASRPDSSDVMVGIRLDPSGRPRPLESGLPNVYSYLPTEQDAGVRFFVQGHFDVPVDRERINPESDWNRWILSKIPELLETVAQGLLDLDDDQRRLDRARGLLEVLPRPEELNAELFEVVVDELSETFDGTPVIPCNDGQPRPPTDALLAPEGLAKLFEGARIDLRWTDRLRRDRNRRPSGDPIWCSVVVPDLDPRDVDVARRLGVDELALEDVVDIVSSVFREAPDLDTSTALPLPGARSGNLEALADLFDALLDVLERADRQEGRLEELRLRRRLADAPLVPDDDGRLHPVDAVACAAPELREVYGDRRNFVATRFDASCAADDGAGDAATDEAPDDEQGRRARARAFLDRLGVERLEVADLVDDLADDPAAFADDSVRQKVFSVLASANHDLQTRAAELPLFRTRDGERSPAAVDRSDRSGVVLPAEDTRGRQLADLYGSVRSVADEIPTAVELLERVETPVLDVDLLLDDLARGEVAYEQLTSEPRRMRRLHEWLEGSVDALSGQRRERLASLPIWPDTDGTRHPLVGEAPALVPETEELVELLPDAPWLAPPLRGASHVDAVVQDRVDAARVVDELRQETSRLGTSGDEPPDTGRLHRLADYLTRRADTMSAERARAIPDLPLFADQHDRPGPLDDRLSTPEQTGVVVCTDAVGPILRAAGYRVCATEFRDVVAPLVEARLVDPIDAASLFERVADLDPVERDGERHPLQDPEALPPLLDLLADRFDKISPSVWRRLAVFPTRAGDVRTPTEIVVDETVVALFAEDSPERRTYRHRCPVGLPERLEAHLRSEDDRANQVRDIVDALDRDVETVDEHPHLADPGRRERLWDWLEARERTVFGDPNAREAFEEARLFPSSGGRLLAAPDLVEDVDLPDLGIDWRPADEIPNSLLEMLDRRLGIGTPEIESLVESHLLPAHRRADDDGDVERSAAIVGYLSRRVGGWSSAEIDELFGDEPPLRLANRRGDFRRPDDLIRPTGDVEQHVRLLWGDRLLPAAAYGSETHGLLRKLGVHRLPPLDRLRQAADERVDGPAAGEAIAALLARREANDETPDAELDALASIPWAPDETGELRAPEDLYVRSVEVETLIGDDPERYVDDAVVRHLDETLSDRLGFRTVDDVQLEEVTAHLRSASETGEPVRIGLYEWLDAGLREGWLDSDKLAGRLGNTEWVYTDDESFFHHTKVLGDRSLQMFGRWRGYWHRGAETCPTLCDFFDIPDEPTPEFVEAFFEDVAREIAAKGSDSVLESEPALPRMLVRCAAFLGRCDSETFESLDLESVPVVTRELRPSDTERVRVVPSTISTLYRSDTPTLESRFGAVGVLHLARRGDGEDAKAVDEFYTRVGLERLGDAYTVDVSEEAGRDRTEAYTSPIDRLRGRLRGLRAVLPRIQKQRGGPDEAWLYDDVLDEVIEQSAIRAVEDLSVQYELPEVGTARSEAAAVWDPDRRALLVDTDALREPDRHATGLAEGLDPTIYDGSDDAQLVDILVILLPRRTRRAMDDYLDRRHFPTVESSSGPADELGERLREVVDFGLHEQLAGKFDELEGLDFERWREPRVAENALGDGDEMTEEVTEGLLGEIGATEPGGDVLDAVHTVLTAPNLDAIPTELLGHREKPDERDFEWSSETDRDADDDREPGHTIENLSERLEEQRRREQRDQRREQADGGGQRSIADRSPERRRAAQRIGESAVEAPDDVDNFRDARREGSLDYLSDRDDGDDGGVLDAITGFFGESDDDTTAEPAPMPSWSRPDGNPFEPDHDIGPQMWVTPDRLRQMSDESPDAQIEFEPPTLGWPHRYAIRETGGKFDPQSQHWCGVGDVRGAWEQCAEPTDQIIEMRGRLPAGACDLPLPMFGRLERQPQAVSDGGSVEYRRAADGTPRIEVDPASGAWEEVTYAVRLMDVPEPEGLVLRAEMPDVLFDTTLREDQFPDPVRQWLGRARGDAVSTWKIALAVQSFVRDHYEYDEAFLQRDSARRRLDDLEAGRGNHHLQVMHAAGSGDVLGRGICYELNILVAELLRHLEIPSLVATGWVFDRGRIDRPDHLFALALVETDQGPCLLPLDAATDDEGPIRPMAPDAHRGPTAGGASPLPRSIDDIDVQITTENDRDATPDSDGVDHEDLVRLRELSRAVRLLHRNTGRSIPGEVRYAMTSGGPDSDADAAPRIERLRSYLEEQLEDPQLVDALLELIGKGIRTVDELTPEIRRLDDIGVVDVRRIERYRVRTD